MFSWILIRTHTVDDVLRFFNKALVGLEKVVASQQKLLDYNQGRIEAMVAENKQSLAEVDRARKIMDNLKALIN